MINLDTHILVRAIEGRLNSQEEAALRDESWCISDIVIWEVWMLGRRGDIRTTVDDPDFNRVLREITIWPISRVLKNSGRSAGG